MDAFNCNLLTQNVSSGIFQQKSHVFILPEENFSYHKRFGWKKNHISQILKGAAYVETAICLCTESLYPESMKELINTIVVRPVAMF